MCVYDTHNFYIKILLYEHCFLNEKTIISDILKFKHISFRISRKSEINATK